MRGEGGVPVAVPVPSLDPGAAAALAPVDPTGGVSRRPAVATCSGWTSPRKREAPPMGAYSSTGTRYGATGRA